MRSPSFFVLIAFVLLGAGCADGETSRSATRAPEPSPVPSVGASYQAVPITQTSPTTDTNQEGSVAVAQEALLGPVEVSLTAGNFFFDGETITAKPGQQVTVVFGEVDGGHTFVIDDVNIRERISSGGTVTFTAPMTPGEYPYYCDVSGHRKLGMEGQLVVTE